MLSKWKENIYKITTENKNTQRFEEIVFICVCQLTYHTITIVVGKVNMTTI